MQIPFEGMFWVTSSSTLFMTKFLRHNVTKNVDFQSPSMTVSVCILGNVTSLCLRFFLSVLWKDAMRHFTALFLGQKEMFYVKLLELHWNSKLSVYTAHFRNVHLCYWSWVCLFSFVWDFRCSCLQQSLFSLEFTHDLIPCPSWVEPVRKHQNLESKRASLAHGVPELNSSGRRHLVLLCFSSRFFVFCFCFYEVELLFIQTLRHFGKRIS